MLEGGAQAPYWGSWRTRFCRGRCLWAWRLPIFGWRRVAIVFVVVLAFPLPNSPPARATWRRRPLRSRGELPGIISRMADRVAVLVEKCVLVRAHDRLPPAPVSQQDPSLQNPSPLARRRAASLPWPGRFGGTLPGAAATARKASAAMNRNPPRGARTGAQNR